MLDGVTAAVLGVMVPLVVADITHGGGRFNLALGIVGLASGIGGALSTALGGVLSDRIGDAGTFLALGAAGAAACVLLMVLMPETHRIPHLPRVGTSRPPHAMVHRHQAASRHNATNQHEGARRAEPPGA